MSSHLATARAALRIGVAACLIAASAPLAIAPASAQVNFTDIPAPPPSGRKWDEATGPAPYGTQPEETTRRQAFKDRNMIARNSLPASGPVNGWYQTNPKWSRQENCNTMIANGQSPRSPAQDPCRR